MILRSPGRPVVYPANTSVTAYTGQRLDISVEFCANPPSTKRFWITETQRLAPGQTTSDFIAHNVTTKGDSIIKNQNQLIAYHTPNQLGQRPEKNSGTGEGNVIHNNSFVKETCYNLISSIKCNKNKLEIFRKLLKPTK
ncbi:hypothetical protein RUM43_008622 [Polyplax serrata]|uniref:Uncharacterized protein n=1 Tax=Polyplax serrata TaxID=468196 RepID=A0AAN8P639_POLSC